MLAGNGSLRFAIRSRVKVAGAAHLLCWLLVNSISGCERNPPPASRPLPHLERDRHYLQGNAHLQEGRYQEASEAYRDAIAMDSLYAPAYCYLGNAYVGLWRWKDAVAAYRTAIRLDSTFLASYHNLATAYAGQGRYSEALEQLDRALQIDPRATESTVSWPFFTSSRGICQGGKGPAAGDPHRFHRRPVAPGPGQLHEYARTPG